MKKLFYIANMRLPTEKAHGIQIMEMCQAFADQGYEVELVVPNRKSAINEDPFSYYSIRENFKIRRLWSLDAVRFGKIGFWIQSFTFAESAAWYALRRKGLFYTRDELLAFYLKSIGKDIAWESHMGQKNIFVRALIRLRVLFVVITGGLKDLYIREGVHEDRILVAHDAVNLRNFVDLASREEERERLQLPKEKKIIAYIGKFKTLGKSKGVEGIVSAFKYIYTADKDTFLLIVGPDKKEAKELEDNLKNSNLPEDSYKIVEHVKRVETPKYMRAVSLLIMAYPNTLHYAKYMSPLKLFEYMASGTPIVASNLPSIREILDDHSAYFFNVEDEDSFKKMVAHILRNTEEANQRAVIARKKVEDYTWEKRAKKILGFIYEKNFS